MGCTIFWTLHFARFPKAAVRKFGKICLIVDNAPQHHAKIILRLVDEIDGLTLKFLQAATPEISAIEIYWRDLKCKVLDVPHTNLGMLRKVVAEYTRYAKPNLDVEKILQRSIWERMRSHAACDQRKLCIRCHIQLETQNLSTQFHMIKICYVYYIAKVGLSVVNITQIFYLWYRFTRLPLSLLHATLVLTVICNKRSFSTSIHRMYCDSKQDGHVYFVDRLLQSA